MFLVETCFPQARSCCLAARQPPVLGSHSLQEKLELKNNIFCFFEKGRQSQVPDMAKSFLHPTLCFSLSQ